MIEKGERLVERQERAYLMSTDRVSEVGTSSSNFGVLAGTIPSLVSTISSRRLVSVSLRYRNSIVKRKRGDIWRILTYSLCISSRA